MSASSRRRRSRRSGGSTVGSQAKSKLLSLAEHQQQQKQTHSEDELFQRDSQMLRDCIATLFRAGSTLQSYRYAAQKVEANLASEQLWSQLCVLYAPTLKRFEEKAAGSFMMDEKKLAKSGGGALLENENKAAAAAAAKATKKKSSKSLSAASSLKKALKQQRGGGVDGDEDAEVGGSLSLVGGKRDRLPNFVKRLDQEQQDRNETKSFARNKDPNKFFAFGRGGQDDDDVDFDDFVGDGSGGKQGGGKQNEGNGGDDDEDLDDDDFEEEEEPNDALQQLQDRKNKIRPPMLEGDQLGNFRDDVDDAVFKKDFGDGADEDEEDLDELDLDYGGDGDDYEIDEEDADAADREMYGGMDDGDDEEEDLDDFGDNDDDLLLGDGGKRNSTNKKSFKQRVFDDGDEGNSHDDLDDLEGGAEQEKNNKKKTPFQLAEEERQQRIRQAEQNRLAGSWQMKGEVAGGDRPRDALLDEDLIMEHALPSAPVITESLTAKLEERLKKRILANHFDDVVRRNPRLTNIHEDARAQKILLQDKMDMEGQKSKASLVDLYEKEFLERQQKNNSSSSSSGKDGAVATALSAMEQDELKTLQQWKRIAQHLDALSNFHFTPKPVAADLDARVRAVQDQAPAISVESKGMFALSREKVLAPQDLFRPKLGGAAQASGATKEEMTPDEKRSVRAAHKRSHQVSKALGERRKHQVEQKQRDKKGAVAPHSKE